MARLYHKRAAAPPNEFQLQMTVSSIFIHPAYSGLKRGKMYTSHRKRILYSNRTLAEYIGTSINLNSVVCFQKKSASMG